ncbi:MAG TPA: sigma 54-interacting transcriptional regulator [Polyangium sp.]|nr:sigma 54-interacting transcriptional regulator [Polyangium sp.]
MASTETTLNATDTASGDKPLSLALTIAYHPDLDRVGQRAILTSDINGTTSLSRDEPSFFVPGTSTGEPLADEHISRSPIKITATTHGSVRIDVSQSKTKVRIGEQRVTATITLSSKDIERGAVLLLGNRVVLVLHRTQQLERVLGHDEAGGLIGESDGLRQVLWDIKSMADRDKPVLIRGETGTGKELVAAVIHRLSRRTNQTYSTVNLAAIPSSLAASELFGVEKGAYTGALPRIGYFEQVDGGTLFLDEIGDAPAELQLPLFRVVDKGEIQPVGSTLTRKVDVRIIAATDADLESKMAEGSFRAALLNRFSQGIWIPPLRDRREDIGRLLCSFLRKELASINQLHRLDSTAGPTKPWLPASLVANLVDFDWPGNVRQLRNVVESIVMNNRYRDEFQLPPNVEKNLGGKTRRQYMVSLAKGATDCAENVTAPSEADMTDAEDPNSDADDDAPEGSSSMTSSDTARRKPADITELELKDALHECRWNMKATAKKLGLTRSSLYMLRERFPWFKSVDLLTAEEIVECFAACQGDMTRTAQKLEASEMALRRRVRQLKLVLTLDKKKK